MSRSLVVLALVAMVCYVAGVFADDAKKQSAVRMAFPPPIALAPILPWLYRALRDIVFVCRNLCRWKAASRVCLAGRQRSRCR